MAKFEPPSFKSRSELATKAKQAALEKFLNRARPDDSTLAGRRAERVAKEEAGAAKRAEKRALWENERNERKMRAIEIDIIEQSLPELTDGEKRAARNARYSGRTIRQS